MNTGYRYRYLVLCIFGPGSQNMVEAHQQRGVKDQGEQKEHHTKDLHDLDGAWPRLLGGSSLQLFFNVRQGETRYRQHLDNNYTDYRYRTFFLEARRWFHFEVRGKISTGNCSNVSCLKKPPILENQKILHKPFFGQKVKCSTFNKICLN